MNYTLISFSPTGGTVGCAKILAAALAEEWHTIDLLRPIPETSFDEGDLCLIAVPSFGGRIPTLCAERLEQLCGGGAKAVLLCVYGNRAYEDTLSELQDLLEARGFVCIAAVAAIAEHSVLREFAAGRPDTEDAVCLTAFGNAIRERIEHPAETPLILPGSHGTYKPFKNSPFVPAETDACLACGTCAAECPAGAIGSTPDDIDAGRCIKCMRCAVVCSVGARRMDTKILEPLRERLAVLCADRKENELFL